MPTKSRPTPTTVDEENGGMKRAFNFLSRPWRHPQRFRQGICRRSPPASAWQKSDTDDSHCKQGGSKLSSDELRGSAAQWEVSMCVNPVAVEGDGGYQDNKKTKLTTFPFAEPCGFRAQLFDEFVGIHRVLMRLFAEFVRG
jgi:hypothetical protein